MYVLASRVIDHHVTRSFNALRDACSKFRFLYTAPFPLIIMWLRSHLRGVGFSGLSGNEGMTSYVHTIATSHCPDYYLVVDELAHAAVEKLNFRYFSMGGGAWEHF